MIGDAGMALETNLESTFQGALLCIVCGQTSLFDSRESKEGLSM